MEIFFGLLGVALAWGLGIAQFLKTFRSKAGISSLTWGAYLVVNLSWLAYAIALKNPYLLANAIGSAILSSGILIKSSFLPAVKITAAIAVACLLSILGIVLSWSTVALFVTLIAVALRWPQIIKLIRQSDTAGVSITAWVLFTLNNIVWFVVALQRGDLWFATANIAMGVSSLIVACLAVWRRRPQDLSRGSV